MTKFLKVPLTFFQGIADNINKNDKLALLVIFVYTICYKLYFITDGISVLDSAFYLSYSIDLDSAMNYSSLKTSPFYLTALISNLFLKMFSAKLLGLRILQILNYLFLFYCVFRLLRNKIPNICIVGGTLMSLMVLCSRPIEFYYDDLSASLCVLSILLMVKAVEKANKSYIFFSGIVFALNIFARMPNVVYLAFTAYLFFSYKKKRIDVFKFLLFGVCGFSLGIIFFLLIIYLRGDLLNFYNGVCGIVKLSQSAEDSHNTFSMFSEYVKQFTGSCFLLLKYFVLFLFLYCFYSSKYKWGFFLIGLLFTLKTFHTFLAVPNIIPCYFIMWNSLSLLVVVFMSDKYRTLALLLLIAQFVIPLGSDGYFYVSIGYIFSSVVASLAFYAVVLVNKTNVAFKTTFLSCSFIIVAGIVVRAFSSYNKAFTERSPRSELKYDVSDCNALKGVYTDSVKAAEFLYYIENVKPLLNESTLLIGNNCDLMLAVSMEKVLYNNSPKNWGTNRTVYNSIISTYEKTKEKPDVLLRKSDMQDKDCPEIKFMKEVGGYSKKWENEKYTMFSPVN
ncbi:MAG: glycosyltransferase family 39 protein [Bacteroidaceae bacterium]|nr:glycosyltransferase family 39 protein [Bacteroidaceae bacterium]